MLFAREVLIPEIIAAITGPSRPTHVSHSASYTVPGILPFNLQNVRPTAVLLGRQIDVSVLSMRLQQIDDVALALRQRMSEEDDMGESAYFLSYMAAGQRVAAVAREVVDALLAELPTTPQHVIPAR